MARSASQRVTAPETSYDYDDAREENLIGKKLNELRKRRSYTLDDVCILLKAKGIPIGKTALNKWEKGQTIPGAYQFMALCEIFDVQDPVQVFTERSVLNAEGLQKVAEYRQDLIDTGRYAPAPHACRIEYIQMPVHLLAVSAGTGQFLDGENFEMVSVPAVSVPAGAEFGIRVCGDSMEPVYQNGQIVWVKKCERLRSGEVGIFVYDGDGYLKMYSEQMPEDSEMYTDSEGVLHAQPVLVSFNEAYEPIPVSAEKAFQIVGKVV